MSLKNIVTEPDPILRKKSLPLENVNDSTRKLLDDMLQTMYAAPGIGLAAVQIGVLKRIIVVDISKKEEEKKPIFLINPVITFKSKETSLFEEGCLSLPGHFAEIERPAKCKIEYINYNGKKAEDISDEDWEHLVADEEIKIWERYKTGGLAAIAALIGITWF